MKRYMREQNWRALVVNVTLGSGDTGAGYRVLTSGQGTIRLGRKATEYGPFLVPDYLK